MRSTKVFLFLSGLFVIAAPAHAGSEWLRSNFPDFDHCPAFDEIKYRFAVTEVSTLLDQPLAEADENQLSVLIFCFLSEERKAVPTNANTLLEELYRLPFVQIYRVFLRAFRPGIPQEHLPNMSEPLMQRRHAYLVEFQKQIAAAGSDTELRNERIKARRLAVGELSAAYEKLLVEVMRLPEADRNDETFRDLSVKFRMLGPHTPTYHATVTRSIIYMWNLGDLSPRASEIIKPQLEKWLFYEPQSIKSFVIEYLRASFWQSSGEYERTRVRLVLYLRANLDDLAVSLHEPEPSDRLNVADLTAWIEVVQALELQMVHPIIEMLDNLIAQTAFDPRPEYHSLAAKAALARMWNRSYGTSAASEPPIRFGDFLPFIDESRDHCAFYLRVYAEWVQKTGEVNP